MKRSTMAMSLGALVSATVLALCVAAPVAAQGRSTMMTAPAESKMMPKRDGETPEQLAAYTKLSRIGMLDGVRWGVDLDVPVGTTYLDALQRIRKIAAAEPYNLCVIICEAWRIPQEDDPPMMPPGSMSEQSLLGRSATRYGKAISLRGVSLHTAMLSVYPEGGTLPSPKVLPGGEVLVSDRTLSNSIVRAEAWPVLDVDEPTAADRTREIMYRRGEVDGRNWSVSLVVHDVPPVEAMKRLAETAAAEPHKVRIEIDPDLLAAQTLRRITVVAEHVSLVTALQLLMHDGNAYRIAADGSVRIVAAKNVSRQCKRRESLLITADPRSIVARTRESTIGYLRDDSESNREAGVQHVLSGIQHQLPEAMAPAGWRFGWATFECVSQNRIRFQDSRTSDYGRVQLRLEASRQDLEIGLVTDETVAAVIALVQDEFRTRHEAGMKWLGEQQEAFAAEVAKLEAEVKSLDGELEQSQAVLASGGTSRDSLDINGLAETVLRLRATSDPVRLDLHSKRARVQVISAKIKELGDAAQARTSDDAVVAELEKVVALREEQVKALRTYVEAGRAGPADLTASEIELSQARIRLAERKMALRDEAGGRTIARLNDELVTALVDIAETEARLKEIERQAEDPTRLLRAAQKYDEVITKRRKTNKTLESLNKQLVWMRDVLSTAQAPQVVDLGQIGD